MEKTYESVLIDKIKVNGIVGDYVFESIRKKQNYYEADLLEKWTPYIKEAKNVLDIGANLGNHTMYWANNIPSAKIYSFEPFGVNFGILEKNIKDNSFQNVEIINKGVGEKRGYTTIEKLDESNYGATTLNSSISTEGNIEIVDIDSFCLERKIEHIDFAKIDTEGYEESVLLGMKQVLNTWCPDLWIEVSSSTIGNVVRLLKSNGYILMDIQGYNCMFLHQSRHPEALEIGNDSILEAMLCNFERGNKFYKNYETAKQWHKNSLDKNEKLQKEIEKVKIGYGEIEHRFKLKEEECNVKEVVTKELSELNSQRKMLLFEYLDWNEKNKEKIEELQSYLVVKDKENEQLKKNFQAITFEKSKLESEIELERGKQKANIEELQLKYEKLEQLTQKEKQELQEQIIYEKELRNNYKEDLLSCERESKENKEKLIEIQKCFEQKEDSIKQLQSKYEELENSIEKEKEKLQKQIIYEQVLSNNYKEDLSFCKKENEENKEKIEELQKYLLEKEKQRDDLKKNLDGLSLEKQNLEKLIELEKEEKESSITELQLKYEYLQQLTQREKESLREQISYEKGLKNSYKEDLISCAEENREYQAKLFNVQNDLEAKESENEQLKQSFYDVTLAKQELEKLFELEKTEKKSKIAELQLAYESLQRLSEKEKEELKDQIIHEKELHSLCEKELVYYINELEEKEEVLNLLKQYKEEIERLEKQIEEDTIIKQQLIEEFLLCTTTLQGQEDFLQELRQYIRKMETQNNYLISENAEYRRKLSLITDTKLGQLGIKMYHILKKIKSWFFKRK